MTSLFRRLRDLCQPKSKPMSKILQVGAGSGGMVVLDMLCADPRIGSGDVTLVEPDDYKQRNVHRHYFPPCAIGRMKADLAAEYIASHYGKRIAIIKASLGPFIGCSPLAHGCDVGVCAVDNEVAKFAFCELMRAHCKPWTLGEVLSGGIAGFVHRFVPGGPCYGCVASYLKRVQTDVERRPDYSAPHHERIEAHVPASRVSIHLVAALHAQVTLDLLFGGSGGEQWTSLLINTGRLPGVFNDGYRVRKFTIERSPDCLYCRGQESAEMATNVDSELDRRLKALEKPNA